MKICLWVLYQGRQERSVRARQDLVKVASVTLLNKDPQTAVHTAQQNATSVLPKQPCISGCPWQLGGMGTTEVWKSLFLDHVCSAAGMTGNRQSFRLSMLDTTGPQLMQLQNMCWNPVVLWKGDSWTGELGRDYTSIPGQSNGHSHPHRDRKNLQLFSCNQKIRRRCTLH